MKINLDYKYYQYSFYKLNLKKICGVCDIMPRWKKLYAKGSSAERELMLLFESNGFMVARIAGSGKHLNPDILAFKEGMQYAFECKNWDSESLRLEKPQYESLLKWTSVSGITAYIAWRVGKDQWLFIHPSEMDENQKGYSISRHKAILIGRKITDIL